MSDKDYIKFIEMLNQLEHNDKYKKFIAGLNNFIEVLKTGEWLLRKINTNLPEFVEVLHTFINYIDSLPENTTKALRVLYGYGWYVDVKNIDIISMHILSKDLVFNESEVNTYFIDKYNNLSDEILQQIISMFPHREVIVTKAFRAHKNNDYELSIPVLLAQIDGVCFDFTKYEYFKKTNASNPKTSKYFDDIKVNELFDRLLEPLKKTTSLSQNTDIEAVYQNYFLNRHMIMHGKDVSYATEINSCKVISFLAYIVSIFEYIQNSNVLNTEKV